MFPYTPSYPSALTVETQLALFGDLSKLLSGSFLKIWEANLAFGEAMFTGVWQTARAAQPGNGAAAAANRPDTPNTQADPRPTDAYGRQLAGIAADLQDGMSRLAADHLPGLTPAQPSAAARAGEAVKEAAEQSALDAAGENMHAEGHVQTSPTAHAPREAGPAKRRE